MFVKPAPGMIVRDPLHLTPIPAGGREVPDISYWHRLVVHGDLALAEAPVEAPITIAEPAAKE
jgi:hypothetical protein